MIVVVMNLKYSETRTFVFVFSVIVINVLIIHINIAHFFLQCADLILSLHKKKKTVQWTCRILIRTYYIR